ncbi:unnamed protein product [Urochloa decumbens]|uniref:Potassium channel domain-containing protein n=1 Tax=Urochloa decumbens TaxID=240449 RepID=A0ABC9H689_9POAL
MKFRTEQMAENGVQQHLLPDHDDDDPSKVQPKIPPPPGKTRRFRRCHTAPSHNIEQGSNLQPRQGASAASPPPKGLLTGGGTRPRFWLVGVLLVAYLLAGTAAFYLVMHDMSGDRSGSRALDALYFCVVTMTTVGYGDLVPSSDAAKLLACAFAFAGVGLVGAFLSKAADYLVEKQESLLFRATHHAADDKALRRDMEANRVRYKLYTAAALLAASLGSGTAFLVGVEGMRPVDAFYCACATVTTLGYGDRSFATPGGRAFAAAWITVSTLVVALFFLYAAELGAERRQRALARWVLTRRTTSMDLEAADLDGDRRVGAAEFALYKLKELGKISQEEIAEFLEEFDELDADHSGTLSCHDLAAAQPG